MRTMNLTHLVDSSSAARVVLAISLAIVFAAVFGLFSY